VSDINDFMNATFNVGTGGGTLDTDTTVSGDVLVVLRDELAFGSSYDDGVLITI